MNIEELIHDLRARVNPQYYDQIGTESYERHQCVMALESLLARIEVLRVQNAALRADAARIDWLADVNNTVGSVVLPREIVEANVSSLRQAIDAARYRWLRDAGATFYTGGPEITDGSDKVHVCEFEMDAAIDAAKRHCAILPCSCK